MRRLALLVTLLSACGSSSTPAADAGGDTGVRDGATGDSSADAAPMDAGTDATVDSAIRDSAAPDADVDAGPMSFCDGVTGTSAPLAECSAAEPCTDAIRPGELMTRVTISESTIVPTCRTTDAARASFDDGAPHTWTSPAGLVRHACIARPSGSSARPLVLFFHGATGLASSVYDNMSLRAKAVDFDLSGDASAPGFILASVQGRFLHWPTENADSTHHDFYFRDADANPDFQHADALIDELVASGEADASRVYAMGWSNGAFFAQLYAILRHDGPTPGGNRVAAAAVYAGGDPFFGVMSGEDPSCAYDPMPTTSAPIYLVARACDGAVACDEAQRADFGLPPGYHAQQWITRLRGEGGDSNVGFQIVNGRGRARTSCASVCNQTLGLVNHVRWPDGVADGGGRDWEPDMLSFLRDHPLAP